MPDPSVLTVIPSHPDSPAGLEHLKKLAQGEENELRIVFAIVNGAGGRMLISALGLPGDYYDAHSDLLAKTLEAAGFSSDLGSDDIVSYGGAFVSFDEGRIEIDGSSTSLNQDIPRSVAASLEETLQHLMTKKE